MQKVQIFLREDQKAALKTISAQTGQRQSDLIRKGVDLLIERTESENVDWRQVTRAVAGLWKDRDDLDDVTARIRGAMKKRLGAAYDRR